MGKGQRTDPHRPAAIVPADYRHEMAFHGALQHAGWPIPPYMVNEAVDLYRQKGAGIHGGIFQCDICGANYKTGVLWEHVPTGQVISLGEDCEAKYNFCLDADETDGRKSRRASEILRAEREFRAAQKAKAKTEFLAFHPGLEEALKVDHHIVADIADKLALYGDLSPKQVALVFKIANEVANPKAAPKKAEAPEGRVAVEGVVVGMKTVDGAYGLVEKIVVQVGDDEAGYWKAYGTLPAAVSEGFAALLHQEREELEDATSAAITQRIRAGQPAILAVQAVWAERDGLAKELPDRSKGLRGTRVRFTAAFKRSEQDSDFAFFKRPTKAEVVF